MNENTTLSVSIPLRPSSNPNDKPLGALFVCLKISNAEDCAKLALSNLIIDCGETIDKSEHKIENIDAMIEGAEIVMKSNLPRLLQDAIPSLDALSNVVERIADVCMIYITYHYLSSNMEDIILGSSLSQIGMGDHNGSL